MEPIDIRVVEGSNFLDRVRPGWEQEINIEELDLSNGRSCVLGQLYGTYFEGERELERYMPEESDFETGRYFRDRFMADRGFVSIFEDDTEEDYEDDFDLDYGVLTDNWRRLIESRIQG